ncbi:hydrogenase expression/formation protein HypE [Alteribacter natronophilus]|uniref:hydrogenase expression/formation protein HypE n=1 Tax=Alteribacter natronophilus TaxID=2583810 RepID=UPI00110DABDF|nr:hydrogenase expression/formation protein HypE [Alteribacter natronophilus]TMW71428.1 hydrogenase expression/formation protein HypE [Alteribacter natronophilus]
MKRISLAHGEGGELTERLIRDVFVKAFGNEEHAGYDAAVIGSAGGKLAVTTDSFVVKPLFFPGGNIGTLAVTGTVNDLAVSGAVPLAMTAGFILEEGFPVSDLKAIVSSMAAEAAKAGVAIVAGDTKVVSKGEADGVFINTAGIGRLYGGSGGEIREGDKVIISGTVGDHGIAILSARNELGLLSDVKSDCASLHPMLGAITEGLSGVRIMRDPTRGGLATALVEICEHHHVTMELWEGTVPVKREVEGACDILGFDPLYLANEGKAVFVTAEEDAERILARLRREDRGKQAQIIGTVTGSGGAGKLLMRTAAGATRRLHRLSGLLLPRIC